MKKLMLILMLTMLTACQNATANAPKIMSDFVEADKIMIYYRASSELDFGEEVNLTSFRYPAQTNSGTNIKDTPIDIFNEEVNGLTHKLNKNIFDTLQTSLLEKADEAVFDENKVVLFFKNLENDGLIYFYSDGHVKEVCADGTRNYYYLNTDDCSFLNSLIEEYIVEVSHLQKRYLNSK
ncbi:MAG: hypothetical protein MR210_03860 [Erysipelotrichaceae bacterium]|nr:hypothetical protein [Erysipelotrichaceae bacterium]MDY5251257.1 hypothetical protein [Erysipelotrichaceae bacterium]